jgi:UDP-3-O-[3-hydroxymyristoyl] N-acetylglucosamine deacetylase
MQQTLKKEIIFKGIGLHSGKPVTMRVAPASENTGVLLTRSDIDDSHNTVEAKWNHVVPSELCTLLAWQGANGEKITISTIEHILSALRGANIDNAHITLDGPEVPIMDGSAIEFFTEIEKTGVKTQSAPTKYIRVLKEVRYEEGDKYAVLKPSNMPTFRFDLDFDAPAIGEQTFEVALVNGYYKHDIASARTFCTLDTVDAMRERGLALGGSLENAVVIDGKTVMNPEGFRFENECARHKTLDAIGDLYLAGAPILGAFHGYKAGHAMHTALLRELFADESNYEVVNGAIDDLPAIKTFHQEPAQRQYASVTA